MALLFVVQYAQQCLFFRVACASVHTPFGMQETIYTPIENLQINAPEQAQVLQLQHFG